MNTLKLKRVAFPLHSVVVRSIMFLCLIGNAVNATANLNQGLIAYYLFDGNAQDISGNSNHGTLSNNVLFTEGKFGQAVLFSNQTELRVTVPDAETLDTPNTFTLSAWINPSEYRNHSSHNHVIISKWWTSPTIGEYILRLGAGEQTGRLGLTVANTDNGYKADSLMSSESILLDNWSHVAATFDHGLMKLFINGQLVAEKQSQVTHTEFSEYSHDDLYIGNLWTNQWYEYGFIGNIDEVRLYNRALLACEIEELYSGNEVCNHPPLLATLTSFNAKTNPVGNGILVKWETTEERDSSFFRLWRFIKVSDGKYTNPTLIVEKLASGNPTIYSYEDGSAESGKIYTYRLSEVEIDGDEVFYLDDSAEAAAQ
jgi:hypothetical protein